MILSIRLLEVTSFPNTVGVRPIVHVVLSKPVNGLNKIYRIFLSSRFVDFRGVSKCLVLILVALFICHLTLLGVVIHLLPSY